MESVLILLIGYMLGCISPAAWISKRKNVDLRREGSGNLGATNTALVLGRGAGLMVMMLDMAKSYLSSRISKALFPHIAFAGLMASFGCIVGHCFPALMEFRGGKGLAAFGGMVIAVHPLLFLVIVIPAVVLMAILNTSVAVPILGGILFPVLMWAFGAGTVEVLIAFAAGILIIYMHRDNLKKAITNTDVITVRGFWNKIVKKPKE